MTLSMMETDWAGALVQWLGPPGTARPDPAPQAILICEHASNRMTGAWAETDPELLASHAASDPGALGLAIALGAQLAQTGLTCELVHAPFSRLIYDLNRSPDRPDACPAKSEIHHVAMNQSLRPSDRLERMEKLYLPFHNHVRARIARALALGERPFILTVHSFSPTWHGMPRDVEFGIIHDALPELARAILAESEGLGLVTRLNAPYSAEDNVTHSLRLHALPYGLENAMLELRNDLIATEEAQAAMAAKLMPVLCRAMARVGEDICPA